MTGAKKYACMGMKQSKGSVTGKGNMTPKPKGGKGNAVQRAPVNNPPMGKPWTR